MMERYSGACRFILSCNYVSKIIDPIQSRCAVFRFRGYTPQQVRAVLERIAAAEHKTVRAGAYDMILAASSGDLRRATNILQLAATYADTVTEETVKECATTPLKDEVERMLGAALSGDFLSARGQLIQLFADRGASGEDILRAIHSYLPSIGDEVVPPREKLRLIEYLGEIDYRLAEGASERLQLETVLARLALSKNGAR
jgi:replication factor C small subunit